MSLESLPVARFRLGRIITTPDAQARLSQEDILRGIQRHQAGDWGEVDAHERAANEDALTEGTRLLSTYRSAAGVPFCVITEADREATTILLPHECQITGLSLVGGSRLVRSRGGTEANGNRIANGTVVPTQRFESAADLRNGFTRRTLKIEADGDRWTGIKPKIRLKGNWLERAGFKPGNHVSVTSIAVGVLELRSDVTPPALNKTAERTP